MCVLLFLVSDGVADALLCCMHAPTPVCIHCVYNMCTNSPQPAVPSRLSVQSLPTATKPKPKRRGLGGRKGMFSDDLSDLSFDSESEYGEEDSWEDEQDTTREDLAEMLAQPSTSGWSRCMCGWW